MEIEINLYKDWSEIILKEITSLKKAGFVFDSFEEWNKKRLKNLQLRKSHLVKEWKTAEDINQQISNMELNREYHEHLLRMYFNLGIKLVEPMKREVKFPTDFSCPPHLLKGYLRLIDKVRRGDSLFPPPSHFVKFPVQNT